VAFVHALAPDAVVLVADAGLGTIDAVRLACDALAATPFTVLLNRFDPSDELHRRNRDWLVERDGIDVRVDVRDPLLLGPRVAELYARLIQGEDHHGQASSSRDRDR
jgi:hypothetical protein